MDSGNSGSIQSSSGGDDDYDSRAAGTSFNNNQSSSGNPIFNPSSTMFDPLSNYFDPPVSSRPHNQTQTQNQHSLLNLDMISWPKSQHSLSDHITNTTNNPFFGGTMTPQALSFPQVSETIVATSSAMAGNVNVHVNNPVLDQSSTDQSRVARNPKKRSRASRRAPTTVLTTDTSNFRAMVQEFTGIPAPPFTSNSSPFPRTRLDLFTSPTPSLIRSHPFPYNQNHNLLRPFAHKIQPPFSSPIPSSLLNNSNINITNNTLNITSTTSLLKPPGTNLVNTNTTNMQMQNTFQSFLQPPSPKFQHTSSNDRFGHRTQEDDGVITGGFNFTHNNDSLSFEGNKGFTENVSAAATASTSPVAVTSTTATRGEGLMDSWICSSD